MQRYLGDTVGARIRTVRMRRGMSQEALAGMIGSSKQVISRYETGARTPTLTMAARIAEALGVSVDEIATGTRGAAREQGEQTALEQTRPEQTKPEQTKPEQTKPEPARRDWRGAADCLTAGYLHCMELMRGTLVEALRLLDEGARAEALARFEAEGDDEAEDNDEGAWE